MTDHEMRVRLAEAMGWTEIRRPRGNGVIDGTLPPYDDWHGIPPRLQSSSLYRCEIPNPLKSDHDAAALEVWCVTTRPWCAGLTIIVDPAWVEVCVDTYEGDPDADPDAESVVVHRDAEPDPRQRRRSALCQAICRALDDPEAGGEP